MAIAHVKHVGTTGSTNPSKGLSITPGSTVAAGNLITVTAGTAASGVSHTVSDTQSNTYTQLISDTANNPSVKIWVGDIQTALTTSDSIDVTFSSMDKGSISVEEWSGLSTTEDTEASNRDSSSTTPTSTAAVMTNAANLVFGFPAGDGGGAGTKTEDTDTAGGSGWTTLTESPQLVAYPGYKITTSAVSQTYNPTFTISRNWYTAIVSLKETAGGATPSRPSTRLAMLGVGR